MRLPRIMIKTEAVFLKGKQTMSRGMPSLTALLGLLAIAGYQNRDKLAEMLSGTGSHPYQ